MNKVASGISIIQMPAFKRRYKKLTANVKVEVDTAIHTIVANPYLGQLKKGDLAGVYVYKFKAQNQEYLLAYEWDSAQHILLALGIHENFYRGLK